MSSVVYHGGTNPIGQRKKPALLQAVVKLCEPIERRPDGKKTRGPTGTRMFEEYAKRYP